jgi:hypothetical protein
MTDYDKFAHVFADWVGVDFQRKQPSFIRVQGVTFEFDSNGDLKRATRGQDEILKRSTEKKNAVIVS